MQTLLLPCWRKPQEGQAVTSPGHRPHPSQETVLGRCRACAGAPITPCCSKPLAKACRELPHPNNHQLQAGAHLQFPGSRSQTTVPPSPSIFLLANDTQSTVKSLKPLWGQILQPRALPAHHQPPASNLSRDTPTQRLPNAPLAQLHKYLN